MSVELSNEQILEAVAIDENLRHQVMLVLDKQRRILQDETRRSRLDATVEKLKGATLTDVIVVKYKTALGDEFDELKLTVGKNVFKIVGTVEEV